MSISYQRTVASPPTSTVCVAHRASSRQAASIIRSPNASSVLVDPDCGTPPEYPLNAVPETVVATEKALALAPNLAESHIASGISHCIQSECDLAVAGFERAIEIDPRKFEAWYFCARTRIRQGRLREALRLLQEASRVRPEDYESVLLQTQLYVSLDDSKRALEASRQGVERAQAVLELKPDDIRALNLGASAWLRMGETEKAHQWMEESLAGAPWEPVVLYNAACFYALAGDQEKSVHYLEKCYLRAGAINPDWLRNDSDLDNVRHLRQFVKLLPNESAEHRADRISTVN